MTTTELIDRYRLLANDDVLPYRLDDVAVQPILLEAETEAAIRARLILDADTIAVTAGTATYALDAAFYELVYLSFAGSDGIRHPLKLVSTEYLDGARIALPSIDEYDIESGIDDWRDETGTPCYAIQSDTSLRLTPTPTDDGTLSLEGYRVPVREADDDPEIGAIHHAHLVQWAVYRRFNIVDEDHFDGQRAQAALAEFAQYFGPRPDADVRRLTRHDTPHHVEPFFV